MGIVWLTHDTELEKDIAPRTGGFFEVSEIAGWTLCSALHYAHAHAEIVHRDLKPAA